MRKNKKKPKVYTTRKELGGVAGVGKKTADVIDRAIDSIASIPDKIDEAIKKAF